MSDGLVYDQQLVLDYKHTLGAAHRAFLRALTEGRLLASGDGNRRYVPARPFAPDGTRLAAELEEVSARGVVLAATTAHHRPGAPVFGLIRIDGSETAMLHRLEQEVSAGTSVEAVWEEGADPSITAIRWFRATL